MADGASAGMTIAKPIPAQPQTSPRDYSIAGQCAGQAADRGPTGRTGK